MTKTLYRVEREARNGKRHGFICRNLRSLIRKGYLIGLVVFYCMVSTVTHADAIIDITQGVDQPTSIAVVPFAWRGKGKLSGDAARIIEADLQRTGQFIVVERDHMLSMPHEQSDVFFRDWRALGVDYLLIGQLVPEGERLQAQFALFDVYSQQRLMRGRVLGGQKHLRSLAHAISDSIYEELTGVPGIFSTQLLYVAISPPILDAQGMSQSLYQLIVSDSDGFNAAVLLKQPEPIVTPAWSPTGDTIAYVSFETGRPAVFKHDLKTGERIQLTDFAGLNGAPAWSPDGEQLALVLSKDGSPDIYVMDLATQQLKRVTSHFAIDTEPEWLPDGKSLLYTSDRGGRPQIYQVDLASGRETRRTFEGNYNTRARALPDGSGWVMVHREEDGHFTIAKQDLKTGVVQQLVRVPFGEAPGIAPNGAMLLYITQHQGKPTLTVMSLDGSDATFYLPSPFDAVRDPAWGPIRKIK